MFYWCGNESCRNVWSIPIKSPEHHKLPVDVEQVITFLENERREAEKASEKIGDGRVVMTRRSRDGLSVTAHLRVSIKEDVTLRPYDAVYYGNSLGVVINHSEKTLELVFDASKTIPHEGSLTISEPLVLYDSALSIINEKMRRNGNHLATFINFNTHNQHPINPTLEEIHFDPSRYGLDDNKIDVVSNILSLPQFDYSVIEGPPGTGKTTVIASAACEIAKAGRRVLITSHTNVAVDNALERIVEMNPALGDKIARIGHPAKVSRKIKPFIERQSKDESRREWLERLLREKKIIGMTIAKLAVIDYAYGLQGISESMGIWPPFDYMFVDESSMVPLGIAVIPMYYSKRWLIIGDTRQLPPIIKTKHHYIGAWSIMEVASLASPNKVMTLNKQRRGNSAIFSIVSRTFYGGILSHDERASTAKLNIVPNKQGSWLYEVLNPDNVLLWIQVDGLMDWCKVRRGRVEGASGVNVSEAAVVLRIYKSLIESGLRQQDIAIITTYRAQANLIRESIKKSMDISDEPIVASLYHGVTDKHKDELMDEEVETADSATILDLRVAETVDSYQGREKPCIIYSITNHAPHIALQDYRRINVAITRAKAKLIIVSSLQTLHNLPWFIAIKNDSKVINIKISELNDEVALVKEINKRTCKR